ncbi:MAG: helix-turn-helix transcriptional regulator [Gammaproteobacteria bacterium]|jgi:DNA-binding HxlR family transcriptional regulator|nr:helix-turn-helix transcriptional regulator [Gammaproteobacteria bacterium]
MRKTTSINYRNEAELIAHCPLAAAMKLLGGRWKLMLLWYIGHGQNRYGRLRAIIPHISEKMLYQQLRELERDGLLERRQEGTAVIYSLTALAASVQPTLAALAEWSAEHRVADRLADYDVPAAKVARRRATGT